MNQKVNPEATGLTRENNRKGNQMSFYNSQSWTKDRQGRGVRVIGLINCTQRRYLSPGVPFKYFFQSQYLPGENNEGDRQKHGKKDRPRGKKLTF